MTICPAMVSMSETMWVERITIRSSASVWIKLRNRTRSRGASPAVGSSRISCFGSFSMATAMPTRWGIPRRTSSSFRLQHLQVPLFPAGGQCGRPPPASGCTGGRRHTGGIAGACSWDSTRTAGGDTPAGPGIPPPQGLDVLPLPQDLSLGWEQQGSEHLDEGGLARPIGGQQTVDAGVKVREMSPKAVNLP